MLKKSSIPLINTQFGGKGELAIKAYQLYFVSCIIAAKNYVPREEAQAFMNSLYPKAWGRKEKACLVYYNRYLVTAGLRTKMALELCVFDIAEYIAGKDIGELEKSNPEAELMITGALNIWSDIFTIWTTIMVASAFQDHKTASELKAKVNSALADLKK